MVISKNTFAGLLFLAAMLLLQPAGAQKRIHAECGTVPSEQMRIAYTERITNLYSSNARPQAGDYYVRVFIHDYIGVNGADSAWTRTEINDEFQVAASIFKQYNICLILAGVDFPRNDNYKDSFSTSDIGQLSYDANINHYDYIDISLHKILFDPPESYLNGSSYNIPSKWISLSRGAIGNKSMAHELGHALGLYHVFETGFGLECPDGSNGTTAGDKISDTRATPDADIYMELNTGSDCVYNGNRTLNCNGSYWHYNPEVTNVMCYGRRTCRSDFSSLQVALMKSWLDLPPSIPHAVWTTGTGFVNVTPVFPSFEFFVSDTVVAAGYILMGRPSTDPTNILIGGQKIQQFIASGSIILAPGVQTSVNALNNNRGYIEFKAGTICDMQQRY